MTTNEALIKKYNVPVPRYTSYPTVPFWKDQLDNDSWFSVVKKAYHETGKKNGISLYIHLPFCESLCTYCACNTRITKNHSVEKSYIKSLLNEWSGYVELFGGKPLLTEIHLGGGTPTFFNPTHLQYLLESILINAELKEDCELSLEGHPNNTTEEHLLTLHKIGFDRVSFGVQDLDYRVQKTINRIQPYENLETVTGLARKIDYKSVNFDLVYGLPFQSPQTVRNTIEKIIQLEPERIAYYSYAHVPWKRPGQRAYSEKDLPNDQYKRNLYELGKDIFLENGYYDIGMDHFAKPGDSLYRAWQAKSLHRNFMGYTTSNSEILIGLGTSAISDAKHAYAQNDKTVEGYQKRIEARRSAVCKGIFLSAEDRIFRKMILEIACNGELDWGEHLEKIDLSMQIQLNVMEQEGLIELFPRGLRVTAPGMAFLRNICSVFDKKLYDLNKARAPIFSKAI